MPNFFYKGKNQLGEIIQGEIESTSPNVVANQLRKSGVFPITIEEKKINLKKQKKNKIKPIDLLIFTRQLHILLRSGIPISKAFKNMSTSNKSDYLKELFRDIGQSVNNGYELHIALQKHNQFFNSFYINMVRMGEITGRLEEVLQNLYHYLEFEQDMKRKAKSALSYPFFVISVMIVAFCIMMVFVVPAFAKIYDSFKAELPLPTRIMMWLSDFMINDGFILFLILSTIIYLFKNYIKNGEGKLWWDKFKFSFIIIGPILKKTVLARFCKSFALSIKSGVPIVQSLGVLAQVVDNDYIAKHIEKIRESVERGNTLYNSMSATGVFDSLVLEMVATGEESGELDTMIKEVSTLYEEDIKYDLTNLSVQIEPIMLLLLGVMVTLFALAIFLPIWDLGGIVLKK